MEARQLLLRPPLKINYSFARVASMNKKSMLKFQPLKRKAWCYRAPSIGLARKEIDPKGWIPIVKINDPALIEIAKFSVTALNEWAGLTFKLQKLLKAEMQGQVVNGIYFRLIVAAGDDQSSSNNYQAIVWNLPWTENYMNLISFIPVHDAPPSYY
ncbi:Cysteine proteinase inhibitor 5 [Glycine soja]